jgi:hypothetical protein
MISKARQAVNDATMPTSFANLEMALIFSITSTRTSTMED